MAVPNFWQNNDLLPNPGKFLIHRSDRDFNKKRSPDQHTLFREQFLNSPATAFQLIFQPDLNLVLYAINDSNFRWFGEESCDDTKFSFPSHQEYSGAIWASDTAGEITRGGNFFLVMQSDGNLVIYKDSASPENALWSTNTYGREGEQSFLRVQNDGEDRWDGKKHNEGVISPSSIMLMMTREHCKK
jgi:hypothetical protein